MLSTTETEAADGRTGNGGRWGNKRIDGRDWPRYNEELVVRGEFLLPLELLGGAERPAGYGRWWREELDSMNGRKRGRAGRRYEFPDFLFTFLAILHQWLDYRALEGLCRSLAGMGIIPAYPDYVTIWRRVGRMIPEVVLPSAEEIEAAVDATGLRAGSAGEYRYQMYGGARRKFVKVIVMVDVRTRKLLSVEAGVQGEGPSEPEVAASEVRRLHEEGRRVTKLYGDGAYDSEELFEALSDVGAEAAIRIRGSARPDSPGRRGEEVRLRQALGYREWASLVGYGMRWMVEAFFSAAKRKFGERLRARSVVGLLAEAMQRFWAYDLMRSYALARTGAPM